MKNYYFEPFDVIVFPIIDWYYRFQRPQQISTQLAQHGHRVFYLRTYFLNGTKPICRSIRTDLPIVDVQLGLLVHKSNVSDQLDEDSRGILLDQFELLRENFNISKVICIVDLPFWGPLALDLQKKYGWIVVYDSMDHLSGFSNVTPYMLEPEDELIKKSDLILATSRLLYAEKKELNANCLLVPNATQFDHFNYSPEIFPNELVDIRKPIIGYYGAISDWFDMDLVCQLALSRPDWNFILIGNTDGSDISQAKKLSNVHLLGEKQYEILPAYLQHFDTCIIPFKKTQLTEATNPVKLFEYLSAGKSIVASGLDELRYYQEYINTATSLDEWLDAIEFALHDYHPALVEKRQRFARQNTWGDRIFLIEDALQEISLKKTDISVPFPYILPKEDLVSSRLLARHNDADYVRLVFEKNSVIYKQTSFDLAHREADFLAKLDSNYFPRILDSYTEGDYSVVTFKNNMGERLKDALSHINSSVMDLYNFVEHCLNILEKLSEKGIAHRNICRDTILVHGGCPVLIDFGWAVSEKQHYFSPRGLGGYERPSDGSFSDVFSMGKTLEYVNRQHYRAFDWVISLMTANDASLRIADLNILRILFDAALKITLDDVE